MSRRRSRAPFFRATFSRAALAGSVLAGSILACGPARIAAAQQQDGSGKDGSSQNDAPASPSSASLTVGSMSIAANAALAVEAMAIDVGVESVSYKYKLANKAAKPLSLQASVALPDLETSDDDVYYMLPTTDPENIVGLKVAANGSPVPTKAAVQALALGLDQLAELKADNIPLIPFSEDTGKALAAAKPDTLARLDSLGLIAPRDPGQKDAAIDAVWSLHVVRGWMQTLAPSTATDLSVTFAPVKAVYTIDASSLSGLDSLAEQVCVTPQVGDAVTALLKEKGSTASVADITVATDGPARFIQNPRAAITVHKPSPKAVVVFCGMDAASQTAQLVRGAMPETADSTDLRILIFDKDK